MPTGCSNQQSRNKTGSQMKLSKAQTALNCIYRRRSPAQNTEVGFSFMLPPWWKCFMFNQPHSAHMPEKCNSLFTRENWPLTDFHYIYTYLPLLSMHQLGLCNDKWWMRLSRVERRWIPTGQASSLIYLLGRYTISQLAVTETQHRDPETQQNAFRKRTAKCEVQ